VLLPALRVLDRDAALALDEALEALHAAADSRSELSERAGSLSATLSALAAQLAEREVDRATQASLRRALLERSAAGDFSYFTAAEQAFLAIETLSIVLGDDEALSEPLDALYSSLEQETTYVPAQYAVRARQLLEAL
jgi:multidrug resistance efflux pump